MEHGLFARLQRALNGRALDVEVEFTGQKVGQHHGGQQVDGVARLAVDLLAAPRIPLCRLLLRVVFFLYHHAEPAVCRDATVNEDERTDPQTRRIRGLTYLKLESMSAE